MLKPIRTRILAGWRHYLTRALTFGCFGVIVWSSIAFWQHPCWDTRGMILPSGKPCPSLAEDLVPLALSLALWIIALWTERRGPATLVFYFLLMAGVLSSGGLSVVGSDLGSRLFYILLAWSSPLVYFLHHSLLSKTLSRLSRIVLATFVGLACVWSLPPILWSRRDLELVGWSDYWRSGVRLTFLLSVLASLILSAWCARHERGESRRRPIRLTAFGNISAIVPMILLSLIPELLGAPLKVPYEITFFGLLISPLFYIHATRPVRLTGDCTGLKRMSLYYILITMSCLVYLLGTALLFRFSPDPGRDWPIMGVVLGALCVVAVVPLLGLLNALLEWVWYGNDSSYLGAVGQLARSLATMIDRDGLLHLLVHDFAQATRLSWSALFLGDRQGKLSLVESVGLEGSSEVGDGLLAGDPLATHLLTLNRPMTHARVRADLVDAKLSAVAQGLLALPNVALWLPLVSEGVLHGLLLLGPKAHDDHYTERDFLVLNTLAHQAGVAAHNVRLGEEKAAVEAQLRQAQKMEAVGQLAAGVAHDFNNILTSMIGNAELVEMREDLPAGVKAELKVVIDEGHRAANLVRQVLDFSRKSIMRRLPLDLFSFLKEATKLLQRTIHESIRVTLQIGLGEFRVLSDPTMIRQVLANLAVNASDAMPEVGELRIGLCRLTLQADDEAPVRDMQPGEWVVLSVSDSGTGIPPESLPHIFEPFFTTKEPGKGTGLGLAQVYGIVRQHEGYVGVQTEVGRGTTFSVYLPALAATEVMPQEKTREEFRHGHGETILVVEDDAAVLGAISRMLERASYHVLGARDALEALMIHGQRREEVALVLTDMVMPDMSGWDLIGALREQAPDVKAIIMSGYPLNEEETDRQSDGVAAWIEKPVDMKRLARVVNEAFSQTAH